MEKNLCLKIVISACALVAAPQLAQQGVTGFIVARNVRLIQLV